MKIFLLKHSITLTTGKITHHQSWGKKKNRIACGVRVFCLYVISITGFPCSSKVVIPVASWGLPKVQRVVWGCCVELRVGEIIVWSRWLPRCQLPRLDLSFSLPKEKLACLLWTVLSSLLFFLQQFKDQRRSRSCFPGAKRHPSHRPCGRCLAKHQNLVIILFGSQFLSVL